MLQIKNIAYRIGERLLFENATLTVPNRHKVGLVGRNGSGKTTLFRLITGEIEPDSGSILFNQRLKIGTVAQEAPSDLKTLLDVVLEADTERNSLLIESKTASDPFRIAEIHSRLADIGSHTAPSRAAAILYGLGFDEQIQHQSCNSLSGGWRMRVALAATLFRRPDLLLLDEPTNHLDLESVIWLENHLARWEGTVILISHERSLLNNTVHEIVHLESRMLQRYTGGYNDFERIRREKVAHQVKSHTKQQAEIKRINKFVERFRYKATKARQAQSRLKMLERMQPAASVIEDRTISFAFPQPDPLPPPLISLDQVQVGYDGIAVLHNLNLRIDMDDRIALIGPNGNGKSTFIRLLAGRLKRLSGELTKSKKLKIGYFAQHQAEELTANSNAFEHLKLLHPNETENRLRAHLGRFGFEGERANTKVSNLSGGEKAKLLFCLITKENPQMILLDEPTNHLDIDAKEALIEALNEFEGAIILVSHDPHLIRLVADHLWLVEDGNCQPFEGDLVDYERLLLKKRRANVSKNATRISSSKGDTNIKRKQLGLTRNKLSSIKRRATEAENKMIQLSKIIKELEFRLTGSETYKKGGLEAKTIQKELGSTKKALFDEEAVWLDAQETLEAAGLRLK
ncbi:MAG TPA: ABC-F family ATP-binding cassette domain-containing protein [Rhodospirillales bacterium]|nr:ABC-F family ATP-binding cassette domain-containing protein [Rhodospirillales bacterium]